jgi:hypothetical protein
MIVGILHLDMVLLSGPQSLKEKRMVIRRVKDRVRNKFPVSIAEVGSHDLWQRAELGLALVTTDATDAESMLSSAMNFIEQDGELEIVSKDLHIEHY